VRSGFCELGCSFDAKQNALKVLVPQAASAGARVIADCRVERVTVERGRATGVVARALDGDGRAGPTVTVRAAVCLAGSAVGSAALALRSGLPHLERVGRTLRLHPGAAVAGLFDETVEGWLGIPQSYECTEKLRFDEDAGPDHDDRVWIVPAFAHPVGLAAALPGFGAAHMRRMRQYPRLAVFVAMLHDRSRGTVSADGGRVKIRYALERADQRALSNGLAACAELLLAAGARSVVVPFASPLELTDRAELRQIAARGYRPLDPLLTAVHPMGTLPLGSVVDEHGRWYDLDRLWVADGSLFPTSLGGPPQLTIYAAAHKIARHLIDDLQR
jgi:choline dehydrogenase-like flavoprotein